MFKRHLFRRAAILGTGLIGGSVALALKSRGLVERIVGTSRQESSLKAAMDRKVIDEAYTDVNRAIQGADLVILASPVKVIVENIKDISKHLRRGCIVTDVGSTKASIVDAAQKHFPPHVLFVGSHPLAGSEKSGVLFANADLFKGTTCIMTPTEKTNKLAKEKVKHLWTCMGADVKFMPPVEHDEVLAYVSHLPHLVAYSLMHAIPDNFLVHASTGLKDTTRIAGSSAKMWGDISLANYRNVLKAIDDNVKALSEIRKAIVDRDEEALAKFLNQARAKRESLEKKI
ncbi:MAG: prephenate dehydrogenase/arogenate dehydrogenase family protein [Candidatus Omnitrophica bacterium]|nr:prephenate dehydrogenase/arogenate dehydrogenase family protein [Candidatus Omnitrophota bacterium]